MLAFSRFTRYFIEVARLGSLRRASERLNVSASAIDRQILQAEERFGVRLFERLPHGLRPTAAGELLLAATRRWAVEHERLEAQMADLVGLRRGHIRIASIAALTGGFLAGEIEALRDRLPGLTVGISVLDNDDVLAAVVSGEVDFGLLLDPRSSRDIVIRATRSVSLGFVVPAGHPLAAHKTARFHAAIDLPMVLPAEPLAVCDQLRALTAATGIVPAAIATSDNIQMVKSLVRAGLGVGVLTSIDVLDEVFAGEFAFVPIAESVLRPLTLALCVARVRQLSHAAGLFLARIEEAFARG